MTTGQWLLPDNLDPEETICVMLKIPRDKDWIRPFFGALLELERGANWQWDGTNAPFQVANRWSEIIIQARENMNDGTLFCDVCPEVVTCIEEDENTQNALDAHIQNFMERNGGNPYGDRPLPTDNIYPSELNPTCDNDILFGQARRFIQWMHTNNTDFLELLELASNPSERVDLVLSAIPGIETLPADELFEVANSTQEILAEAYNASYNTAIEDQLICDLFCLFQAKCATGITPDDIYTHFEEQFQENVASLGTFGTLNLLLQFLITGTYAGNEIVYLFFLLQTGYFKHLSSYFGPAFTRSFKTQLVLGVEVASNDWTTLCDDCPEPCDPDNFTIDEQGWVARDRGNGPEAVISNDGWRGHPNPLTEHLCIIKTGKYDGETIDSIRVKLSSGMNGNRQLFVVAVWDGDPDNGGTSIWSQDETPYSGNDITITVPSVSAGWIVVSTSNNINGPHGIHIERIEVNCE